MQRTEIYEIAKKYFLMSESETEKYLIKFLKPNGPVHIDFARDVSPEAKKAYLKNQENQMDYPTDNVRLQYILEVVRNYCDSFVDSTDNKIKRKVGKLIFSGLNYRAFSQETTKETKRRLEELFSQIVYKKINPYKVLYSSVLTDGNLKVDFENETRNYDKNRSFYAIYDSLKQTLKLSDEDTVKLFEKCSSLISKVSADRIPKIFECIASMYVCNDEYSSKLFTEQEVLELLKINPSLFGLSRHKMWGALNYLEQKVEIHVKDNLLPLHPNKKTNLLLNKRQVLRSWLKNNSSLLAINHERMLEKERFLKVDLVQVVHPTYVTPLLRGVSKMLANQTNLAYLNKIPYSDMRAHARINLHLLESIASPLVLEKYIAKNPFVFGMNHVDLNALIIKMVSDDGKRAQNIDNFFASGRALFSNKSEFNVDEIYEKLTTNKVMFDLDVENLSGKECLLNFADIFMDNDQSLILEIENLIKEKKQRLEKGEKALRKRIRFVGIELDDLPAFIKADDIAKRKKNEIILAYAKDVQSINESRFQLANVESFDKLRQKELEDSRKIEHVLNSLRDVYEQKRFHVGKKYQDSDLLFEKMMEYLGGCFDDKEAISEIFSKEIAQKYLSVMQDNFEIKENNQIGFIKNDLVVKGVDGSLISSLKTLSKEIEAPQDQIELNKVVFEK